LTDSGNVLTVNEAVFLDSSDRHLDDAIIILTYDRFFGDDVGYVIADRLANFLAVTKPVTGAAVAALPRGGMIGTKDRFHVAFHLQAGSIEIAGVGLVLPEIIRRVL
jgi:hypothetical protein